MIMKSLFTYITLSILFPVGLFAQNPCGAYYPLEKGTTFEMTSYDNKDEINAVITNIVESYTESDGIGTAIIHTSTNQSGKDPIETTLEVKCNGQEIEIDLKKLMEQKLKESSTDPNIEISVSGTNTIIPNTLNKGDKLPDAKLEMAIGTPEMTINSHAYVTDRTVVGKETITTPAGTFDCVIITSNSETKVFGTKYTSTKSWVAEGIGTVKSESYSKKGKLQSREELTKFSK